MGSIGTYNTSGLRQETRAAGDPAVQLEHIILPVFLVGVFMKEKRFLEIILY